MAAARVGWRRRPERRTAGFGSDGLGPCGLDRVPVGRGRWEAGETRGTAGLGTGAEVMTWWLVVGQSDVAGGHVRRAWMCPAARGGRR